MKRVNFFFLFTIFSCLCYSQQDVSFVGDVNGDFIDELVLVNTTYSTGAIRAINLTTGLDIAPWVNHSAGLSTFSSWMDATDKIFLGDVNSDNRQELVLVNTSGSGGAIRVVNIMTGADVFPIINHGTFSGWMDATDKIFLGDVNGDNNDDLVLVNTDYNNGAIRVVDLATGGNIVYINHGSFGGWMDPTDRMFLGDVNGDTKDDLVLVNTSYNSGAILAVDLMSGGNIAWIGHGSFSHMMDPSDKIFLTDINGDNKMDLLMVNTNSYSSETAFKGVDIYNNGADLSAPPNMPIGTAILHGTYNGFMDDCDRIYCKDLNGDLRSELILINTSINGQAIRIINPQTGYTSILYDQLLDGWLDPSDRILFAKFQNNNYNILLVNSSCYNGAIRAIDNMGNCPIWLDNSSVNPGLVGWLDGAQDMDYLVSLCPNTSGFAWDESFVGDGSISREIRPYPYQLFPRKANNQAVVKISGTYTGTSILSFNVKKTSFSGETSTIYNSSVSLVNHRFSVSIPINAELSEYTFTYGIGSDEYLIADHVVCGDAYIISGQSNASAEDITLVEENNLNNNYGPGADYGKYSRTYGNTWCHTGNANNGGWGVSRISLYSLDSNITNMVGAWGIVLQYIIQEKYKIPTCLINGAVAGTSIDRHLPMTEEYFWTNNGVITQYSNGVPATPGLYDRFFTHLNTRVYYAGLENDISGIFWLQSDGGNTDNYISSFQPLYDLWAKYFPSFKKIYLIQIHSYTDPSAEMGLRIVSEYQRVMQAYFPKMEGMTANGIGYHRNENGHEVHFQDIGYAHLAHRLLGLVGKDVYGNTANIDDITPPNIISATIFNSRVSLTFDQNLSTLNSDTLTNVLSVIKFGSYYNTKTNPSISGSVFSFDVSDSNVTSISYAGFLPNCTSPINPDFPCYLKNAKNIAAFSFNNFPIIHQDSTNESISNLITKNKNSTIVYPNPFSGDLTISSKTDSKISLISIYSVEGKIVFQKAIFNNIYSISLPDLKNGLYLMCVYYDDKSIDRIKLIKTN
jgi:hypothetical protein